MAAPVDQEGTPVERWLEWGNDLPELAIEDCPRLILVSAHADDETLGLGATAAMMAPRVQLVCATDTPGMPRREELKRAAQSLGLPPPLFLGYNDGGLAVHIEEMAETITEMVGENDWVASPWRGDGHPDHEAAGEAAYKAATDANACLIEYPVWMWHWAVPDDPDVPWADAAVITPSDHGTGCKRRAIRAFKSQIMGEHPVLPIHVVNRALTLTELVFT